MSLNLSSSLSTEKVQTELPLVTNSSNTVNL